MEPLWKDRALTRETTRPCFYLCTTVDGRIVMGGGDVKFRNEAARNALPDRKEAGLMNKWRELFPQYKDLEVDFIPISICWPHIPPHGNPRQQRLSKIAICRLLIANWYYLVRIVWEAEDVLPYIGEYPGIKGVFFTQGYGGNSTTFSAIGAGILRNRVRARRTSGRRCPGLGGGIKNRDCSFSPNAMC